MAAAESDWWYKNKDGEKTGAVHETAVPPTGAPAQSVSCLFLFPPARHGIRIRFPAEARPREERHHLMFVPRSGVMVWGGNESEHIQRHVS